MKKLIIVLLTAFSISAINAQTSAPVSLDSETTTAADFDGAYVSYLAPYNTFDKGCYGIGFDTFGKSGFGGTFSVHANYGILDPGQLQFLFGPIYGLPIHENIMVMAKLRGFIFTYDKPVEGKNSTEQKVNGGILAAPGIKLRFNRVSIGAAFNFGWIHNEKKMHTSVELGIGYNI